MTDNPRIFIRKTLPLPDTEFSFSPIPQVDPASLTVWHLILFFVLSTCLILLCGVIITPIPIQPMSGSQNTTTVEKP